MKNKTSCQNLHYHTHLNDKGCCGENREWVIIKEVDKKSGDGRETCIQTNIFEPKFNIKMKSREFYCFFTTICNVLFSFRGKHHTHTSLSQWWPGKGTGLVMVTVRHITDYSTGLKLLYNHVIKFMVESLQWCLHGGYKLQTERFLKGLEVE